MRDRDANGGVARNPLKPQDYVDRLAAPRRLFSVDQVRVALGHVVGQSEVDMAAGDVHNLPIPATQLNCL